MDEAPESASGIHHSVLQKPPGYKDPSSFDDPPKPPPPLRPLPSFYPPNASKYRRSRWISRCRWFFCWFLRVFFIILLFLILSGVVSYIYFQPRFPSFHLQSLNVSRIHISFHSDSAFLDSTVATSVQVKNHNRKINYSYRKGNVTVFAVDEQSSGGDVGIGSTSFPRFQEGTMKTIKMTVRSEMKKSPMNGVVGKRLKSMLRDNNLKCLVVIQTTLEAHLTHRFALIFPAKIMCNNVLLKNPINPGSLPPCTIVLQK